MSHSRTGIGLGSSLEFNWIVPGLAQGSYPLPPAAALDSFDTVVFAAMEAQPRVTPPPRKEAILFPLDDNPYIPVSHREAGALRQLATKLARQIRSGRKVLVTCMEGRNRSGLIVGSILIALGHAPRAAVELVKKRRSRPALTNPMFERYLATAWR